MAYSINVNRFVGNLNWDYSTGKTFKNKTAGFFNFEKCCYINVLYGHFRCKRMPHKQNWNKIIITIINRVVRIINDCVSSNIFSQNVTHLKPRRKSCPHTVKQQVAGQRPARTQCILLCVFVKIRPFGNLLVFLFFFFLHQKESMCVDTAIMQWSAINSTFGLHNGQKDRKFACSFFVEYCFPNSRKREAAEKARTVDFF